ncbi:hypothetical protein Bcep18194_B2730 [Burkholderia lata]|uniref:Uncharacterized protein n=1 Tax=Burkholderia lata (strain ATCC 17760 / DSM 23089 / LMG 22485 / NCIMB 9086 / R18194 / 383) TaxID=482957 RepID=Q391M5_BURL3|nr:hypothetical protein Bcep18194_B2730 [Burkholderia lata]
MMLHPRAQYAIDRGQSFAQSNCSPFRHFPENDFLLENVTTAGDGPTINRGRFIFEHSSRSRHDARIPSRNEMNRMRQRETRKELRPVFTDCRAGSGGNLAHGCSG